MILDIIAMTAGLIIIGTPLWSFIKWGSKKSQEQAVFLATATPQEIAEYKHTQMIQLISIAVLWLFVFIALR